jgi:hypothetical protein
MAHRQPDTSPNTPVTKVDVTTRLIELLEHDPGLALSVLAVLEEAGIANGEFVRTQRARLSLARGDRGALIEHSASGSELTPQQAIELLAEALAGTPVPTEAIGNATRRALPLSQSAKGKLISALRATQDRGASASAYEAVCAASGQNPSNDHMAIVDLGIEIITRIAATPGELNARKTLTLRVIRAGLALAPSSAGRMLDEALKSGLVRSYDVVHEKSISAIVVVDEAAAKSVVSRAESGADLEAAALLTTRINDEGQRGRYLRVLCKRYTDDHEPTPKAAKSVALGINSLVALHQATPSTEAASHDEALLRRWAALFADLRADLGAAADQIAAARAPHTQRYKEARVESEQTAIAKRFVKERIVPEEKFILLVGGSYTKGLIDAFNEFHPPVPTWGDWIVKERSQPLKTGEVDERVGSPKCAGVVIIMKPAGHMIVEQAKTAAQRHGKPSVTISNSSKSALRDGLRSLLVRMARDSSEKPVS